jgi:FKBP-type peptidyl-prolyl cis-trans isomerase SlyD
VTSLRFLNNTGGESFPGWSLWLQEKIANALLEKKTPVQRPNRGARETFMQITKDKVALIDYTLKNDAGEVLDTSVGGDPLAYLHGADNIIPGLETALEGKSAGEAIAVSVPPEEGYGVRDESLRQQVAREQFESVEDLEVGMQFRVPSDEGDDVIIRVEEIGEDTVTVDGNHELAGMTLHFAVTVREVRDATDEEKAHGHVHGLGGHHL